MVHDFAKRKPNANSTRLVSKSSPSQPDIVDSRLSPSPVSGRVVSGHQQNDKAIQHQDTFIAPMVSQVLNTRGTPLDSSTREYFEPRFGEDFSQVRVHTSGQAAASAQEIHARAYTLGSDIVFGQGQYMPSGVVGRRLLAHELTHVVQQGSGRSTIQRAPSGGKKTGQANAGAKLSLSPRGMVEENSKSEDTQENDEKKEVDLAFGSAAVPWFVVRPLILKFPSRWSAFAQKAKDDLTTDDQALLSNMSLSLQNLMVAGINKELSSYKPSWSKSLKISENLSGVSSTYLNLISFAVMKDLEKYLSDDVGDDIKQNLGWMIIYGALLQGGLVGVNALLKDDLDFTSLISPATGKWTKSPEGLGRPFQLKNVPDPRWTSYGFGGSASGAGSTLTGFEDSEKPYAFGMNLGLNIASIAELYPEGEKEKSKYKGFELYPYFNVRHESAQGDAQPTLKNRWLVGVFYGAAGAYTLLEGGQQTRPDDTVAETYLRTAFMLRGFGNLSQLQLSSEYSFRPENRGDVRARLNAAAQITLMDRKKWEATVGVGMGGLLPSVGQSGAFDAAGNVSIHHKHFQDHGEKAKPFKTGLTLGSSWRREDPFNADSSGLFSVSGKFSVLDMVILSFEHHRIREGQSLVPDQDLPGQDTRVMLMFGPGVFRWK